MRRRTSRRDKRDKYPSHWPVHVIGMAEAWQPLPTLGPALAVETTPSSVESAGDGELTASPWIGLHYAPEGT
jgi:hypothetical protein